METFVSTAMVYLASAVVFLSGAMWLVGVVAVVAGMMVLLVTVGVTFVSPATNTDRGGATAIRLSVGGAILGLGGPLVGVISTSTAEFLGTPIVAPVVATPLFIVAFAAVAWAAFRWQPPIWTQIGRRD